MPTAWVHPSTQELIDHLRPRYPVQIRFLIEGGKLREEDGWGNVVAHCLIQAAALEELGEMLDLHPSYTRVFAEVAAAHDGLKRLERRPEDFTHDEANHAYALEHEALPTEKHLNQMKALNPRFHLLVRDGKATLHQKIQFYVDDVASPSEAQLIPFDERIDEVSARNPDPEPEVEAELGRPYWEAERELGHEVEREIWELLRPGLHELSQPEDIPGILQRSINHVVCGRWAE